MNIQRVEDYKSGTYALAGDVVDSLPNEHEMVSEDQMEQEKN